MACPPSRDSIKNEAKCEDFVIHIPPDLPHVEWPECCIYRVPKKLHKINEEAYTPKLVSIGPFHYGRKELRDMEMHKLRYFMDFWKRTTLKENQKSLLKIIEDNEENIRHCYSEDFRHRSSIDFVKMILLDAIFIIELFLKTKLHEKDYILNKPLLRNDILHDLILLENQLPFFVLEKLCKSACNDSHPPFLDLSCNFFTQYKRGNYSFTSEKVKEKVKQKVNHLTDLVRHLFCPPDVVEKLSSAEGWQDTRFCATKLDDAGFNFEGVGYSRPLLDITLPRGFGRLPCCTCECIFRCLPCVCLCFICCPCLVHLLEVTLRGSLKVPKLVIDYETEVIFRNLMALEQCHYPSTPYICSYVWLLDRLIETEKDVDLLVKKKVIANNLGSNAEVATLINKLGSQIVATTSSYDSIARELNKHYEDPLTHFFATLKREYFPNIFRGTATIVGLIILGFTLWNFLKDV